MSLTLRHPLLARLRGVGSWADLPVEGADPRETREALEAWAALEEGFGDDLGAAVHRDLAALLPEVEDVPAEFAGRAAALRAEAPAGLRPLLERLDVAVAAALAGDRDAWVAAESVWVEAAASGSLEELGPDLLLSLCCDGASLHAAAYDVTGDPRHLDDELRLLDVVLARFRDGAVPTWCRVALDPRLSRYAGRAARLRVLTGRDLGSARDLAEGAIGLTHPDAPDHAGWLLERGLLEGYFLDEDGSTEAALERFAAVVAAEPPGTPLRVEALDLSASAAWAAYRDTHDLPLLDLAVAQWRRAYAEAPAQPAVRRRLATALAARHLEACRTGPAYPAPLLDEAAAVLEGPGEGSTAVRWLDALAGPLADPASADLVDLGVEALARLAADPAAAEVAERAAVLSALLPQAQRRDPERTLEVRADLLRCAVRLDDGPRWAARAGDLAVVLQERFVATGDLDLLGQAVDWARRAADRPGAPAVDRARAAGNAGTFALRWYDATGDLAALSEAVRLLRSTRSADLTPRERSGMLGNLATALRMLPEPDLDGADAASKEAAALADDQETRARALAVRGTVLFDRADLDGAVTAWQEVLTLGDGHPIHRYNLGNALLARGDAAAAVPHLVAAVQALERTLPEAALCANRLAEALHTLGEVSRAARWSSDAVEWARRSSPETLLRVAWDAGVRAGEGEAAATAYAAALDAVVALVAANRLQAGKERWLAEAYGVPTRLASALAGLGRPDEAVAALERGRGVLLADTLGRAPGEPTAGVEQPLAYLVPGRGTGVALVLLPGEPARAVALPHAGEAEIGGRVRAFHAGASRIGDARAWRRTLDRVVEWLGSLVAPLAEVLPPGAVTLVPCGALAFLPLHAAPPLWGRVVSYAPTATSLEAARGRPSPGGGPPLVVVDPQPTSLPRLEYAALEGEVAASLQAGGAVLPGTEASVDAVLAALPGAGRLHLACHGRAEVSRPRSSGLVLSGDEVLTVDRIAGVDLSAARLAMLSACETAVPGAGAPDEVVALGSAFFAAGVDGVVASLWPVPDLSTLLLVTLFYDTLDDDPAAALARAQGVLRETTVAGLRARLAGSPVCPEEVAGELDRRLAGLSQEERAFAGPDHWAAFTFTGF